MLPDSENFPWRNMATTPFLKSFFIWILGMIGVGTPLFVPYGSPWVYPALVIWGAGVVVVLLGMMGMSSALFPLARRQKPPK